MKNIKKILSILIVIFIIIAGIFIVQDLVFSKNTGHHSSFQSNSNNHSKTSFQSNTLGKDELDSVTLEGPYGNPNSTNKKLLLWEFIHLSLNHITPF
jgi:hypothetical protein